MAKYKFNKWQLKWLEALESGEYAQSKEALCDGNGFCCLGVACEALGLEAEQITGDPRWAYDGNVGYLPKSAVAKLKLNSQSGLIAGNSSLVEKNDCAGWSHKRIAEFIRKNPELVFKP